MQAVLKNVGLSNVKLPKFKMIQSLLSGNVRRRPLLLRLQLSDPGREPEQSSGKYVLKFSEKFTFGDDK